MDGDVASGGYLTTLLSILWVAGLEFVAKCLKFADLRFFFAHRRLVPEGLPGARTRGSAGNGPVPGPASPAPWPGRPTAAVARPRGSTGRSRRHEPRRR